MTDLHTCPDVAACPECRAGKHDGCNDLSWCNRHDGHEPCPCFLRQHGPASVIATGQPYEVSPEDAAELAALVEQANHKQVSGPPVLGTFSVIERDGRTAAVFQSAPGARVSATGPTAHAAMNAAVYAAFGMTPPGIEPEHDPEALAQTERQNAIVTLMAVLGAACENRSVDGWSEFHDRFLAALTTLGVTGPEMHAAVTAMDRSGVPWRT